MAKEIRWTKESIETFDKIIDYLQEKWTDKEVRNFVQLTEKIIFHISENPKMFRKTNKINVHEALITPHNLLIYKYDLHHVDLLVFWDTRQHQKKKKTKIHVKK